MKALTKNKVHDFSAAVVLGATSFLVNPIAAVAQVDCVGTDCIEQGVSEVGGESDGRQLFGEGSIFNTITNTLLFLVGVISVIMLIIGGIRYVVSGGDQNAVTGAKNTILYAIIGIVVAFLAFAAVNFVTGSLNPQ